MKKLEIPPRTYLLAAFLLLCIPLRWVLAWCLAAATHEIFHILAIHALGGRIRQMRIGIWGSEIAISPMTMGRELICTLAGPMGGLMLLLFIRWMPCIGLCGLIQSLWNLLPVYPMDGGRSLRCLLCMWFGEHRGHKWADRIGYGFLSGLVLASIWGVCAGGWGHFPVLMTGLLLFHNFQEKLTHCQSNAPESSCGI